MQSVRFAAVALVTAVAMSIAMPHLLHSQSSAPNVAQNATRRCVRSELPAELPPLPFVIDEQGFKLAAGKLPNGSAMFGLGFDANGAPLEPTVIQSTFSDSIARSLLTAIASTLKDQPSSRPWSAQLRVTSSRGVSIEIQRSERCHVEQTGALSELDNWLNARVQQGRRLTNWSLVAQVTVDSLGHVGSARVLGPPPFPYIQGIDAAVAQLVTFKPATFEGKPYARTDTVTIGIISPTKTAQR